MSQHKLIHTTHRTQSNLRAAPLMVFGRGKKKDRAALAEEKGYWEGEWICADCGYIYDADLFGGLFFEEQTKGFKCPQCSGPRRRYAKKIGDTVGVTLDGGDGPILAASFGGACFQPGLSCFAFFQPKSCQLSCEYYCADYIARHPLTGGLTHSLTSFLHALPPLRPYSGIVLTFAIGFYFTYN